MKSNVRNNLSRGKLIYNRLSNFYDKLHHLQTLWADNKYRELLITKSLSYNKESKNILEVGCGTGQLTKKICKAFFNSNVYAFDTSGNMLKIFRKKNRFASNILQADLFTLPFKQEQFDSIFFSYVLGGVNLTEKVINEIDRVLINGGYLFICDMTEPPINKTLIRRIIHQYITSPYIRLIWGFKNFNIDILTGNGYFSLIEEVYYHDRLLGSSSVFVVKKTKNQF